MFLIQDFKETLSSWHLECYFGYIKCIFTYQSNHFGALYDIQEALFITEKDEKVKLHKSSKPAYVPKAERAKLVEQAQSKPPVNEKSTKPVSE